ncbi:MAG: hypothetical protein WCR51_03480 [Planctomycetia bacterium]
MRLWNGRWLGGVPERLREPAAWGILLGAVAVVAVAGIAPWADARGAAYLEASFARTLAALAATRGLDSAISLAQSSEVSFSLGPGGSIGIGQALDPINDLVEQYGSLLLTSTTAVGVQRLGLQISQALGWWLLLPAALAIAAAAATTGRRRRAIFGWVRRLFAFALFARLAIPTAACLDELVATRFLEAGYQQASAAVVNTTAQLEAVEVEETEKPWYERFNPVDYVGDRARRLYDSVGAVGESIVNLAIYFTISTIILPLGTLWLLARLGSTVFLPRSP